MMNFYIVLKAADTSMKVMLNWIGNPILEGLYHFHCVAHAIFDHKKYIVFCLDS